MASLPQDVFVEDDNYAYVSYAPDGAWAPVHDNPPGSLYRGASYHQTNQKNASVKFTFTGSFVAYYSDYNKDHGNFTISLDGQDLGTRNSYSTKLISKQQMFNMDVDPGNHTLIVTNGAGGGVVGVDYFMYRASPESDTSHLSYTSTGIITSQSTIAPISTEIVGDSHGETPTAAGGGGGAVRLDPAAVTGIALGAVASAVLLVLCAIVLRERVLAHRRMLPTAASQSAQKPSRLRDHGALMANPWQAPIPSFAPHPKSHRQR